MIRPKPAFQYMLNEEALVNKLGGRGRNGKYQSRCPSHPDSIPSLSLRVVGGGKVLAHCHAGCSQAQVLHDLREIGVLYRTYQAGFTPTTVYSPSSTNSELAERLWRGTSALPFSDDNPVRRYLRNRGLPPMNVGALRFNPKLRFDSSRDSAALVAAIVRGGELVGVHRTFVTDDGRKAFGPESKRMLGEIRGGAVYLGGAVETLVASEGIETGLALKAAIGTSCASLLSASLMPSWIPPDWVKRVIIFPDRDETGIGSRASLLLREALLARGIHVVVAPLPTLLKGASNCCDYLDVFNEEPERVAKAYMASLAQLDLCFGPVDPRHAIGGRQ